MRVERAKRKKVFRKLIVIILSILFIILVPIIIYCITQLIDLKKNKVETLNIEKEINNIVEQNKLEDTEDTVVVEKVQDKKEDPLFFEYSRKPLTDFNISELKSINSDTVAWINLNGTNINVPIVQTKDNEYYLKKDFKKNPSQLGWIYADYRNKIDLTDKNLIIYGHNVGDKTMLSTLTNVLTKNWQEQPTNHILNMSTGEYNTMWQVISVYKVGYTLDYIQTDFTDQEYIEFLQLIKSRSAYNFNATTNKDTKLITLSTCTNEAKDGRIVLHAKLIKYEKRK